MKKVLVALGKKTVFRVSASGLFHTTSCLKVLISYSRLLHISCILIHFKKYIKLNFHTYNVILNNRSLHKAAVLQSQLPKIMKHSSFRQAIQLLSLLLFRSDTSVESSCSTPRLCVTQDLFELYESEKNPIFPHIMGLTAPLNSSHCSRQCSFNCL